jgi:hypothetical protein
MKVEIFRRTVKDRKRGSSYDLLKWMMEGISASGDEPIMINENFWTYTRWRNGTTLNPLVVCLGMAEPISDIIPKVED